MSSYADARDAMIVAAAREICDRRGLEFDDVWPNAGRHAHDLVYMRKNAQATLCRAETTRRIRGPGGLGGRPMPSYEELAHALNAGRSTAQFHKWSRQEDPCLQKQSEDDRSQNQTRTDGPCDFAGRIRTDTRSPCYPGWCRRR